MVDPMDATAIRHGVTLEEYLAFERAAPVKHIPWDGESGCPGGVRWGNLRGMGDAVKVIDWNGTDVPAGVAEFLAGLPPGRYRLAAVPDDEGDGSDLTAEEEEGIREGMRQLDAGEGVPLAVADARWQATLAAARKRAG